MPLEAPRPGDELLPRPRDQGALEPLFQRQVRVAVAAQGVEEVDRRRPRIAGVEGLGGVEVTAGGEEAVDREAVGDRHLRAGQVAREGDQPGMVDELVLDPPRPLLPFGRVVRRLASQSPVRHPECRRHRRGKILLVGIALVVGNRRGGGYPAAAASARKSIRESRPPLSGQTIPPGSGASASSTAAARASDATPTLRVGSTSVHGQRSALASSFPESPPQGRGRRQALDLREGGADAEAGTAGR